MSGDFWGDFIALENVLQGLHANAVRLCEPQQHEYFVRSIAVAMDLYFASCYVGECLEPQVAAWFGDRFAACSRFGVSQPRFPIRLRFVEGAANRRLDAHSRVRVTRAAALWIFPKCELNALRAFTHN